MSAAVAQRVQVRWILVVSVFLAAAVTPFTVVRSFSYDVSEKGVVVAHVTERGAPVPFIIDVEPRAAGAAADEAKALAIKTSEFSNQLFVGPVAPVLALADWLLLTWICAVVVVVALFALRKMTPSRAYVKLALGFSTIPIVLGGSIGTGLDPSGGAVGVVVILGFLTRDALFTAGAALAAVVSLALLNPLWDARSVPMVVATCILLVAAIVAIATTWRARPTAAPH